MAHRSRARAFAAIAACALLAACTAQVEPGDEPDAAGISASAEALTRITGTDFEDYARGALGNPWSLVTASSGSSTRARITRASDHGNVLQLDADPNTTDYLTATLGFLTRSREIETRVTVDPDPGAAFVWTLSGTAVDLDKRHIRLQRAPHSSMLVASTVPNSNTRCGRLPSGTWSTLTLHVHAARAPHTFDVLIDGRSTACKGLVSGVSAPFRGVSVMDASNAGWGGTVRFDDIVVRTR